MVLIRVVDAGHHVPRARQFLGEGGERAAGHGENPGERSTSGRLPSSPAGSASAKALVRVLLSRSGGTPVTPLPFRVSSDSFADM
ncbi:hypothetical protein Misp01_63950 [Microtetraspora sp. NBRC 13810]|uniref:hypothetical protein n=1 Tax=Microtetraspora sp. NBRC 13810 TaxID=3030990 RepID=UPI0024A59D72|nr:hypothetical protein [Microtetraspora sp. NBRC 13810]GLW11267.1 hypothetical protein Misp01_63950 [Microtetraspora sp. NBRC 13810]